MNELKKLLGLYVLEMWREGRRYYCLASHIGADDGQQYHGEGSNPVAAAKDAVEHLKEYHPPNDIDKVREDHKQTDTDSQLISPEELYEL